MEDIEGLVDRSVDSLDDKSAALLFGDRLMEYVKQNFLIKKETLAAAHKIPLEKWIVPDRELTDKEKGRSRKQAELSEFLKANGSQPVSRLKERDFPLLLFMHFF